MYSSLEQEFLEETENRELIPGARDSQACDQAC